MNNIGTLLSHNIWQSIIIFALVFAVLKLIKNTSAEERSWSWSVALFTLAILPLAEFLPGKGVNIKTSPPATDFTVLEQASPVNETPLAMQFVPKVKSKTKFDQKEEPIITMPNGDQILNGLLYVWMTGTLIALIRLGMASYNAFRLRQSSYPFAGLNDQNWPDDIEIAVSDEISSPIVIGTLKPLVLISRTFAFEMNHDELKPLLYHELAHIKRGDTIFHLLERIVLSIYWWNPVMHLIARNIAEERELACDDRAAKRCGDQLIYASSLLKGARKLMSSKNHVLGLAVLRRESVLSKRVKRLTIADKFDEMSFGRFLKNLTVLFSSILVLAIVTPRIAIGQVDVNVEERVDQLYMTGGVEEVLMEMKELQNDHMARAYTKALVDIYELEQDQIRLLINLIDQMDNSFEKELALKSIAEEQNLDEETDMLMAQVAMRIEKSDIDVAIINEIELEKIEQEIEAELQEFPTEEEIQEMREEIERELEDFPTAEEMMKIREDSLASIPSIEELQEMWEEALADMMTKEELEEIRREAMESIPSVEEIEEMRKEAMEALPTREELEEIRREALESLPTFDELAKMHQDAMESIPTTEEIERMRQDVIEDLPTAEELESMRQDMMESLENLPTKEELQKMREAAYNDVRTHLQRDSNKEGARDQIVTRFSERGIENQIQ